MKILPPERRSRPATCLPYPFRTLACASFCFLLPLLTIEALHAPAIGHVKVKRSLKEISAAARGLNSLDSLINELQALTYSWLARFCLSDSHPSTLCGLSIWLNWGGGASINQCHRFLRFPGLAGCLSLKISQAISS